MVEERCCNDFEGVEAVAHQRKPVHQADFLVQQGLLIIIAMQLLDVLHDESVAQDTLGRPVFKGGKDGAGGWDYSLSFF